MGTPAKSLLRKLEEGHKRFLEGKSLRGPFVWTGQELPFNPNAIVVTCVDPRINTEALFDAEPGTLMVLRNPGAAVTEDTLATLEMVVQVFGIRVIVFLPHSHCGALIAASKDPAGFPALGERVSLFLMGLRQRAWGSNSPEKENVDEVGRRRASEIPGEILKKSPLLKEKRKAGEILIAGGFYNLKTGAVEWGQVV